MKKSTNLFLLTKNAIYGTIENVRFEKLNNFTQWFQEQDLKSKIQIQARLNKIENELHFGDVKGLGSGLAELRWKNGRRIYFSKSEGIQDIVIILILGGNKNGQSKDIARARKILSKIKE